MSIELLALDVRHERRIRLVFSNALAGPAFATSFYTVVNTSDSANSPLVTAAMIVAGNPNVVELAFDTDLVVTATYRVTASLVPAVDATVTDVGSHENFRFGKVAFKAAVEPGIRDRERLLFQCDIIWNGVDYEETSNGDLARVEGRANVTKAIWHAVETPGLPWDPSWGVNVREFVDSPSPFAGSLSGALTAQIAKDPRVARAKATVEIENDKTYIHITPTLIDGESTEAVSVVVPNDA